MKIKQLAMLILVTGLSGATPDQVAVPHIMSFFFVPCSSNSACRALPEFHEIMETINHEDLPFQQLRHHLISPLVKGIYTSYAGYITYSDYNGQVTLPNKQPAAKVNVVITSQIYPVLSQGVTVHHFEVPEEVDTEHYTISRIQDESSKKWYWDVVKKPRPKHTIINEQTLVIHAKPKDIEILSGRYPAQPGPHLILPDMYVLTGIDTPFCVLKFLKVNQFFEPLEIQKRNDPQSYRTAIRP